MHANTVSIHNLNKQASDIQLKNRNTKLGAQHIWPAASIVALRGGSVPQQYQAILDNIHLNGGTAAGALLTGALGGLIGGLTMKNPKGVALGALGGAVPGAVLGRWLTYRTMRKNRKLNDDFSFRHLMSGAAIEGLRGGDKNSQIDANIDELKLSTPGTIAATATRFVAPPLWPLGTLAAAPINMATYYGIKEHRLNKQNKKADK